MLGCEQEFLPWAKLTTRIWKDAEFLEVEWTAGPLPFQDGLGHELVVRPSVLLFNAQWFLA